MENSNLKNLFFIVCVIVKILVILTSYDFDGTQMLSIDEVTLALKSAATGICKLCMVPAPREEIIEQLVSSVSVPILLFISTHSQGKYDLYIHNTLRKYPCS